MDFPILNASGCLDPLAAPDVARTLDVVVTNNGGPVRLLLNQSDRKNHWLEISARQDRGNRFGFGAWIGVELAEPDPRTPRPDDQRVPRPTLWRRVRTDGSYLSASDTRVHFGLGTSSSIAAVVVQWPDGQRERWTGVAVDRLVTLQRGTGSSAAAR